MIVLKKNKCGYITLIKVVYLTLIIPLKYFKPDLNTHNSKFDLYAYYLAKF